MQHPATIEDVVEAIEHIRSRIGMYIHPTDVSHTQSFLTGFFAACGTFGLQLNEEDTWWDIQIKRGWKKSAMGPVPQMRDRGMTEQQIINELIDIEIEVVRQSNFRMD